MSFYHMLMDPIPSWVGLVQLGYGLGLGYILGRKK